MKGSLRKNKILINWLKCGADSEFLPKKLRKKLKVNDYNKLMQICEKHQFTYWGKYGDLFITPKAIEFIKSLGYNTELMCCPLCIQDEIEADIDDLKAQYDEADNWMCWIN